MADSCPADKLYYACLVLIILFLIVAGLALLNCCFYLTCVVVSRTFRPSGGISLVSFPSLAEMRPPVQRGLSRRKIEQLPAKHFSPGAIPAEDAICAICLAEYVPGEKIRSLGTCVHHFHATCIDQWLSSKRNCPLCQANVGKRFKTKPKPTPLNVMEVPVSHSGASVPDSGSVGVNRRTSSNTSATTVERSRQTSGVLSSQNSFTERTSRANSLDHDEHDTSTTWTPGRRPKENAKGVLDRDDPTDRDRQSPPTSPHFGDGLEDSRMVGGEGSSAPAALRVADPQDTDDEEEGTNMRESLGVNLDDSDFC
eukprot:CAMPEP_0114559916 /NCGR_PEP_ID=MMETSP0114-20121206/11177_1 /TAXON_ID=31324 /ORGANISM="Goniomonas sp, Strain m" /LENGTH=310 /DNA_ID=CAMNT_0001745419 /DNA_START=447 /DNA_END=1379 /DNA_ORIENTATION=+